MSFLGFTELKLEDFGGLVTYPDGVSVPWGWSPDLLNVRFRPGKVSTRPGLTSRHTFNGGITTGLAQFINNAGTKELLALLGNGDLVNSAGSTISGKGGTSNAMLVSQLQFNRIFFGYFGGTGSQPRGPIRYYDGTLAGAPNQQPHLAPAGPGRHFTAVDSATAGTVASGKHKLAVLFETKSGYLTEPSQPNGPVTQIAAAPTGAARAANVVTITTTQAHGLVVGDVATVAGVADASFNGTFVVASTPTATTFTYAQTGANGTSGSGTATSVAQWTAAGSKKVTLSQVPTGPWYVVARQLIFTAAEGDDYFYLTRFRIADNTTTTVELDFNDTELQQGLNYNKYFRNFRLPDQAGIMFYGSRAVTWGGLNTIKVLNPGFDGGFAAGGEPLGWLERTAFAGGGKGTDSTFTGEYWRITGNDTTDDRGEIGNPEAATKLEPNTAYTVSIRARKSALPPFTSTCKVTVDLVGTGVNTTGIEVDLNTLATDWMSYEAELTSGLATIPTDLQLRVYIQGAGGLVFPAGQTVDVDHIQIWPSTQKYEASVLRVSDPEDPDRFDGVNGLILVAKDDGQRVIAVEQLRTFLYVHKERAMHATENDGISPPSLWSVSPVDNSVGAGSPNAVDTTEEFIAIGSRAGAYLFFGGRPTKVSQEIQTTWNRINWEAAETMHTLVDPEKKLIFFFVPLDADTVPKHALILDYTLGWGTENDMGGRKWSLDAYGESRLPPNGPTLWDIRASLRFETSANKQALYFGGRVAASSGGTIWEHTGTKDGAASVIYNYYETAHGRAGEKGTDLFGGVSLNVAGSGTLKTKFMALGNSDPIAPTESLANITLASAPTKEYELYGNSESEHLRVRVEVDALDAWFELKRLALYAMEWSTARPL